MNKRRNLSPNLLHQAKKSKIQEVPEFLSSNKKNQLVDRNPRRAGDYILGPEISTGPVDCISHYLARRQGTREFYQLKILTLDSKNDDKNSLQGKILLHSEFQLLSLLKDVDNVIKVHELFSDYALEERTVETKNSTNVQVYTGKSKRRIILVLDNYHPNEFKGEDSFAYINLQQYVTKQKIPEKEALNIFYEIIKVVEILHGRNIIHRDLKLNNIVLDKRTYKVILTNFCLGKHLNNENDSLFDQRGSPAYISPDVLSGNYKGKPSDIWSCGVILYTLIFGHFPFIENTTSGLFKKIRQADYVMPDNVRVSEETKKLIKSLLTLSPEERLTASEVRLRLERFKEKYLRATQSTSSALSSLCDDQVVPEFVPETRIDPSKSNFLTDAPRFENSTEPLSLSLEFLPSTIVRENKTFLKPSMLSPRCRVLSMNGAGTVDSPPPPQSSDMISNGTNSSNVGSTRNLTTQINNLSVRNRINTVLRNISWHNRVAVSPNLRNLYEFRVRTLSDVGSSSGTNRQSNNGSTSGIPSYASTLESQICVQLRHLRQEANRIANSNASRVPHQTIPSSSTNSNADHQNSSVDATSIHNIFRNLNDMFSNGAFPHSSNASEFTGIVTQDIALKLSSFLRTKFPSNEMIREIFCNSSDTTVVRDDIGKILEFLRRFGVKLESVNGIFKVKKEQTNQMLLFLTYLLQISGYSNTYFLNIRA